MRISIVTPYSQNIEPLIPVFESKGVIVDKNKLHPECNAIIGTGQVGIQMVDVFRKTLPDVPLFNLTLDFYKTVWSSPNPHRYDWNLYKKILVEADELWCLSNEVILRMKEEGVDTQKCKLMKLWARFFTYEQQIVDKRYILKTMRPYKYDKNYGWLKRACSELNIPLREPNHKASEKEYQKLLAECSFMCCDYHETSTGGLGLMEGYNLGKLSVISDSPYQGARDYLGDRAIYFNDNDYEDFKRVLKETWDNKPTTDIKECQDFCKTHPSIEDNVDFMIERINMFLK